MAVTERWPQKTFNPKIVLFFENIFLLLRSKYGDIPKFSFLGHLEVSKKQGGRRKKEKKYANTTRWGTNKPSGPKMMMMVLTFPELTVEAPTGPPSRLDKGLDLYRIRYIGVHAM